VIVVYERTKTEISKGALVELILALDIYHDDIVLAGGWAPYFLSRPYVDHCGSIDIDLVLRPSIILRYESIRKLVESIGYLPTENPFRFTRELKGPDGRPFDIDLDFLTEPEAKRHIMPHISVQADLQAALIPGCSIVFTFNYVGKIEGKIMNKGRAMTDAKVADLVGSLTMKGLALGRPRKLEKDSYDIYALAGFCMGSPSAAAQEFKKLVTKKNNGRMPEVTKRALQKIEMGFEHPSSVAPQAVSRFIGSDTSLDASLRIHAFLERLKSSR